MHYVEQTKRKVSYSIYNTALALKSKKEEEDPIMQMSFKMNRFHLSLSMLQYYIYSVWEEEKKINKRKFQFGQIDRWSKPMMLIQWFIRHIFWLVLFAVKKDKGLGYFICMDLKYDLMQIAVRKD